jgi:tetratricopeptide (TPR) repeat protein
MEIYKQTSDRKRSADCLINLGVLKQTLRQHEAAYENYSQALKLAEKNNDYEMRSLCLNNIAQVYFEKGDYERSIAYNQDALKLRLLMDNNLEEADSYLNLALNFIRTKDLEKAREYLDKAYQIGTGYDYFEAVQTAFKIYSDYYSETKEYEKAYVWLKRYQTSRDSILAEQNAHKAEFDFSMPEVTEHAGTLQAQRINNLWLLVSVFIFTIFVPLILIRFKR